jgi:hypothetical protein
VVTQASQPTHFYLFVDESGSFIERSSQTNNKQGFANQLVGFLAPMSPRVFDDAKKVMSNWFERRGSNGPKVFHANKLAATTINRLVQEIVPKLLELGWQPVRLVNVQHVRYSDGDRIANYTNMVAELALRLFQEKSKGIGDRIIIHFQGDIVTLGEKDRSGYAPTIPKRDYQLRFNEYLGFAAVRRGLAREELNWDLQGIKLKNAKIEPALQICDLLSYASLANYKYCSTETTRTLRGAFGAFDQTMETLDLIERLDRLIAEQSFGVALQILAEALYQVDEQSHSPREGAARRLEQIIDRLGQIGMRGRDPHLTVLIAWLDQIVGQQRLYEAGYSIANWLTSSLALPLKERMQQFGDDHTLNWFEYSLRRWALTAANHGGAVSDAEVQAIAMRQLEPLLARQWERIPLLIDGFIAQAVHQTDCRGYREVANKMNWIARSLKLQSNSLQELMQGGRPEFIKYDARGKALGTQVQALTLWGFEDQSSMLKAREVSDEAIAEFSSMDDKARQYQYRCHLETIAGEFEAARRFLLMSILKTEQLSQIGSHQDIASQLSTTGKNRSGRLDDDGNYRFHLQHWLRIGAHAYLRGAVSEQKDFTSAVNRSNVMNSSWCIGNEADWPAHGILRSVAVIRAAQSDASAAQEILRLLEDNTVVDVNHIVLAMIVLAAQAEVAAILSDMPAAAELLDGNSDGLKRSGEILERLFRGRLEVFPEMERLLKEWRESLSHILSGKASQDQARSKLFSLAGQIRY